MNGLINFLLLCIFFILIAEIKGVDDEKKSLAILKEKNIPDYQNSFIDNKPSLSELPDQKSFVFTKSKDSIHEIKPVKKYKPTPKADTVVIQPIVEHLIEPKKIAEPVQLPEPVVIKIDTSKFKSKINVTKAN